MMLRACMTACLLCWARFLISSATTVKPLPASGALAASMAAFTLRRLLCSAMSFDVDMISLTASVCSLRRTTHSAASPICAEMAFRFSMASVTTRTPSSASLSASWAVSATAVAF